MTISITTLGNNSKVMSIDNDTPAGVCAAIRDILITNGWEIWDQVSATNVVMRSKCYDNVNYKYVQLNVTSTVALTVTAWESWNNNTHTGTNAASYDVVGSATTLAISTVMCNISVFYSPRYLHLVVNNTATALSTNVGVFEFYRDNPTDLPANGFPNFFITSGPSMNPNGNSSGNAYINTAGGTPRTRYGVVGKAAAACNALVSPNGVTGILAGDGSSAGFNGNAVIAYPNAFNAALVTTPWFFDKMVSANGLAVVRNLASLGAAGAADFRGRVFGLKTIPVGYGNNGDVVPVPVDANGFSDSSSSTLADHMLFTYFALPL